ncbi:hypothetical protein GCM10022209_44420 [Chitinophaga oryziterrae]
MEKVNNMNNTVDAFISIRKYKKETMVICIAGAVITFLIMIAFSGVLFDI